MDAKEQVNEEWRPVIGYEDCYKVSSLGKVRSVPRSVKHGNTLNCVGGYELKINRSGHYKSVHLSKDGYKRNRLLHLLVLEAFAGPKPEGCKAMFLNGNNQDCSADNLKWAKNEDFCKSQDPTPDEIRKACDEILSGLTPREIEGRAVQKTAHWKLPVYPVSDLPDEYRMMLDSVDKD